MKRGDYSAIDIHRGADTLWPAVVPPMTAAEITRAFKRLYRYGLGQPYNPQKPIVITSGNRRACDLRTKGNWYNVAHLNPEKGWREFVHDLSHDLDYMANGYSAHSKHHARFEVKLTKEVIKRGWLDGRLKDKPKVAKAAPNKDELREAKIAALEKRRNAWLTKQKRATTYIKKIDRSLRGLRRHASA